LIRILLATVLATAAGIRPGQEGLVAVEAAGWEAWGMGGGISVSASIEARGVRRQTEAEQGTEGQVQTMLSAAMEQSAPFTRPDDKGRVSIAAP